MSVEQAGGRAPLVSILMPAYNHEAFVREAVESVWAQTCRDIELVVIDDGSRDRTFEILRELAEVSPIPMVVETQANAGVSRTLNRAISLSRGKWIACLASDDYYAPTFIARHLECLSPGEEERIVQHTDNYLVEADGRVTGVSTAVAELKPASGDAFEDLVNNRVRITPISCFYSRALLEKIGRFDERLAAEDVDLFLRLARVAKFRFLAEPLVYARHTPGSLGRSPWLITDALIASLAKHADRLGDRLPDVLARRSAISAAMCFEYGNAKAGRHWARQALAYGRQAGRSRQVAAFLVKRCGTSLARRGAIGLFGRPRLIRLKRSLSRLTGRR